MGSAVAIPRHASIDRSFRAGSTLAFSLSAALLVITACQSLATFFIRMYQSDVMLGAVGNVSLFSRSTLDLLVFVLGLLVVHGLLALAVHCLSYLTVVAWPATAHSRNGLVVLWFALFLGAVLLQNAEWFPRSHTGSYYNAIAVTKVGPFTVASIVVTLTGILATLVVSAALIRTAWTGGPRLRVHSGFLAATGAAVSIGVAATLVDVGKTSAAPSSGTPNVVIIGIDSLRLEYLGRFGGTGATPNLDAALREANLLRDTVTPLARTFPSWMSILTGRGPRSTGALFNLMYRPGVDSAPTLGNVLNERGYATYYVTDEVRFSNIDESYGFDRVITPPIGAADFLIGRAADLPLSNVLANTPMGGLLLAYLHGNRAVAELYRPSTFLGRVDKEFEPKGRVFLAIHLTAAHWPYYHADTPPESNGTKDAEPNSVYAESLQTADAMFGEVLAMLRRKGVLDNAIVVILSDHGEALAMPEDALVGDVLDGRVEGLRSPARVLNWGHGQSVLSPVQYQVLLAFRGFGPAAALMPQGRDCDVPASLQDVFPTVLDLLGMDAPDSDGESLATRLNGDADTRAADADRIRFTETDIRVAPSATGTIDEDQVAAQAAQLFAVDKSTGWLHLRSSMIPTLMQFKERAAIDGRRVLAALPVAPGRHEYLLVDRKTGFGRVLAGRPSESDVESVRLWDALHEHFAGELHPAVVVGPDEQPTFDAQWTASTTQAPGSLPGT